MTRINHSTRIICIFISLHIPKNCCSNVARIAWNEKHVKLVEGSECFQFHNPLCMVDIIRQPLCVFNVDGERQNIYYISNHEYFSFGMLFAHLLEWNTNPPDFPNCGFQFGFMNIYWIMSFDWFYFEINSKWRIFKKNGWILRLEHGESVACFYC